MFGILVSPGFQPARRDFLHLNYDVFLVSPGFQPARRDFLYLNYDVLYCDIIFHQPVCIPEHNVNTDYCENLKSGIFQISTV